MKLIAVFQVLILLTSVIIPEGPHLMVRDCQCGDDCQCSEESRNSGTCCCGNKARTTTTAKRSCCQKTKVEAAAGALEYCGNPPTVKTVKAACCQKKTENHTEAASCCAAADPCSGCDDNDRRSPDEALGCGCRQIAVQVMVILMPRLRPTTTAVHEHPDVIEVLALVSDRTLTNARLPEVPPPKKSFSV